MTSSLAKSKQTHFQTLFLQFSYFLVVFLNIQIAWIILQHSTSNLL